jgi:predicted nucleic acid-binding Zn ribbon protein
VTRHKRKSRFDGRMILLLIVSLMIVLTMILAFFPSISTGH